MISYDLDKPGQNYERLIKRLREHGCIRVLMSQWVLRTTWTAMQLRDDLANYVDSNDRLLVVGLTGEAAWTSLLSTGETFKQTIAA